MPSNDHGRRILVMLGVGLVGLAALLGRPAFHLLSTASRDADELEGMPEGTEVEVRLYDDLAVEQAPGTSR